MPQPRDVRVLGSSRASGRSRCGARQVSATNPPDAPCARTTPSAWALRSSGTSHACGHLYACRPSPELMIDTVHAYTLPRLNFVRFRTGKESSGEGKLCACAYRVGSLHRVAIEGPPTALKGTPLTRVRRGWNAVARIRYTLRPRPRFFRPRAFLGPES